MIRIIIIFINTFLLAFLTVGCSKPPPRVSTSFNKSPDIDNVPYLLPACFNEKKKKDLVIQVSDVGADKVSKESCDIISTADQDNKAFNLRWSSGNKNIAQVTVSAKYIFSGKKEDSDIPKYRKSTALLSSFEAFGLELEKLEYANCLNKGDAQEILAHTADVLPMRMDESLAFKYGFDAINRYVDLHPGMRLRIEHAAYQMVDPNASDFNAYVGRGVSYLQVIRRMDQLLGFEPFLASMAPMKYVGGQKKYRMISGAPDLALCEDPDSPPCETSKRYARLVFPNEFTISKELLKEKEPTPQKRVVLLLSNTRLELNNATTDIINNKWPGSTGTDTTSNNSAASSINPDVLSEYFNGRSLIIPEIIVYIQGQEHYVPLGTSLHDVLARYVDLLDHQKFIRAGKLNVELTRRIQTGLCSNPGYQKHRLRLEPHSVVTASGLSQWDLPLYKGDDLRW